MGCSDCCSEFVDVIRSGIFIRAVVAGFLSGIIALALRLSEEETKFLVLDEWNPDKVVFNVFIVFASLVATFRTSHALVRFTEAAAMMHKLSACWYDATSTLVAFCREVPGANHDHEQVARFQEILFRLVSLISALIFNDLEHQDDVSFANCHSFEILGWEDLARDFQDSVMGSPCKVEHVFQSIQQLVIDAMHKGILAVPPPILTRSFQELGAGMLIYHEAKKLSCVPLPAPYVYLTSMILISEALFFPFILAQYTPGKYSCFLLTFFGTFMLWFLNGVAESLNNPFRRASRSLNTGEVQIELNEQLKQLRKYARAEAPGLRRDFDYESRPTLGASMTVELLHSSYPGWRAKDMRLASHSSANSSTDLMGELASLDPPALRLGIPARDDHEGLPQFESGLRPSSRQDSVVRPSSPSNMWTPSPNNIDEEPRLPPVLARHRQLVHCGQGMQSPMAENSWSYAKPGARVGPNKYASPTQIHSVPGDPITPVGGGPEFRAAALRALAACDDDD